MVQKGSFGAFLIDYLTMYKYYFLTTDFLKSPLETKTPQCASAPDTKNLVPEHTRHGAEGNCLWPVECTVVKSVKYRHQFSKKANLSIIKPLE